MGPCLHFEREWLGIANDRLFCHESQWVGKKAAIFGSATLPACSKPLPGAITADFFSSFGYRCAGTSLKNVAPSHPARMTDEPLTNLRVLIKYYGNVKYLGNAICRHWLKIAT